VEELEKEGSQKKRNTFKLMLINRDIYEKTKEAFLKSLF
jgi:hypothetical protein